MDIQVIKDKIESENIAIFTHTIPDGDAIGSSCALAKCLKKMGKNACVYLQDALPEEYSKLEIDDLISYTHPKNIDLVICTDVPNSEKLGIYENYVKNFSESISIDHHYSHIPFATYDFLNSKSCSACEFLFDIFKTLNLPIDNSIAELLYLGIIRDCGAFMYDNTTSHTHQVVAELMETGFDYETINRKFMNTVSIKNILALKIALNNLLLFKNNEFAISVISNDELNSIDATINDTGIIVNQLLSIESVKVAVLATEILKNHYKVSIRTKNELNANEIAKKFGGGGHKKASGCRILGSREKIIEDFLTILSPYLRG